MMNISMQCSCGGAKIIDTVDDEGNTVREGIPAFSLHSNESITRCYCEICGTMFHPQSVGAEKFTTTLTRIMPQ